MHTQDSIQARFGGVGLPTAIKQTDEVITHLGDTIAVKEYETHAVSIANHSVARLPIFLIGDGIIHQAFDLTHCRGCLVDSVSMAAIGAKVNPPNDHQNLWVTLEGLMRVFHRVVENF